MLLVFAVITGVTSFSLGVYLVIYTWNCDDTTLETCLVARYHDLKQTCIALAGMSVILSLLVGYYIAYDSEEDEQNEKDIDEETPVMVANDLRRRHGIFKQMFFHPREETPTILTYIIGYVLSLELFLVGYRSIQHGFIVAGVTTLVISMSLGITCIVVKYANA